MACHSFCDESGFSLDEIRRAAAAGQLLTMEVEFSQLCNFRCPYCYLAERPRNELSTDEIRDLILQGRELGVRKVIILGGEPMIYPRILEKIHFIRSHGMQAEIFTNGSNMTPENAAELAMLDVKVVLKMNSQDPQTQNRLCGMDDAHRIISEAYTNLKAAGYGPGGKPLAVSSVISSVNIHELPDLWRRLRDDQIDPYFEMITPQGTATENDWLGVEPERVHALFEQIAAMDQKEYGRSWTPQPPLVGDVCLRHQFSCYVNAFGDVMPCVGVTLKIGSIRENRLADILRDSEVIANLKDYPNTIKGPCSACHQRETCYGCRGAAYQLTGDYLASDPLCWHNAGRSDDIEVLPVSAAAYIPQQNAMRLIDRLCSVGERCAEAETVLSKSNPFIGEDEQLDPVAFMELIAQTAAAMNGFHLRNRTQKPEGFLMGARDLQIQGAARNGDRLHISVVKEHKYEDFGVLHGRVQCDGRCLAEGRITVYHKNS